MLKGLRGSQLYDGCQQQGLGLIEVLVALLLFSSAALGYAILQSQTISSTHYSMMRLRALMILNESTERIRANSQLQDFSIYQQYFNTAGPLKATDCVQSQGCSVEQLARNDVVNLTQQAAEQGFSLGMIDCLGVRDKANGVTPKCLIVAWGKTIANNQSDMGQDSKEHSESIRCFNADGSVAKQADCVFAEIN